MSNIAIRVNGLSKRYRIGKLQPYKALRDTLTDALYAPFRAAATILRGRRTADTGPQSNSFIWALNDVSFEVKSGEVLGIIGGNGAGKSTLLKVLSRITEPTKGYAEIYGRVGSLLEVGTGFHPELTGRENILLNGAILGMTRQEIKSKFDEIVSFAEIEKFIDTPVKRYSSGMYVRLAFAVAAHLEPEILIVDEVLAVGDMQFQKKCLGKMGEVATGGRTVLFVSHNMGAIRQLTSRCICLEKGRIMFDGNANECVSKYLESFTSKAESRMTFPEHIPSESRPVVIKSIALKGEDGNYKTDFSFYESWCLEIEIEAKRENIRFHATMQITDELGINIYHCWYKDCGRDFFLSGLHSKLSIIFHRLKLYPGRYTVHIGLDCGPPSHLEFDAILSAISFTLNQTMGKNVVRQLNRSSAVVHEVPVWEFERM
ncbi:ABC transporter ATP-binding protein [Patescibacteria group bacterium]|nr:ABC transporter ATP-binding protein [Patescibacteria group bacterium]